MKYYKENVELGDFIDTRKGYAFKSKWYTDEGTQIVKVSDFTSDSVDTNELVSIPTNIAEKYQKYQLTTDDVIVQTVGSWPSNPASVVGKVIKIPSDANNTLLNQNAVKLIPNGEIDKGYLFYLLKSPKFKEYIVGTAQGAASQASITLDSIRGFKFNLPDKSTQQKIASILSAFDDLIENNTRRIAILEEMARRIYREWFVHYRYPGHDNNELMDSGTELGEIPEGWEVRELEDVADINPENISTDYKGEIEYINISGVNEGSIDETETHDFEEAPGRAKRKVKHGDIIWSSVRPNLKAYALILNPPANQIASTGFAVIRPEKLPSSFIYNFSTTGYFVQYLVNHTRGSAYPAVNVSDFKNAPIVVPDEEIVEKFDEITWNNYLQVDKLSRKNKKLKETRDLLLPKLISGKIDVSKFTLNYTI